ncbi:alpha/beta fold hydrolase [Flavihumibacter stibioxidans]|uniref:Alpha/beta hydrolase n=1 Tax=Flavihumibacter stibioxidans TaxID=1834163 RepID=A0ABR7MDH1_9BACT|nr:alpha/beta hydrolase [Flavihumibacter stibioxidans]MBC6492997.1 alpha/beta hydrolase [Flavihumibacter stibioxidans]
MIANRTGAVEIDGFHLNYSIEGEGQPILVVGSMLYYSRTFAAELKEKFRFIFIDHRGFVPPPRPEPGLEAYGLDRILDDIETIRRKLQLQDFIILGHSGHAFMALEYAKKYPGNVKGVVLVAVSPSYSTENHALADLFFDTLANADRKKKLSESMASLPAMIEADPDHRFVSYCLAAGPKSWMDADFDASPLWEGIYTNMPMIDFMWGIVFRDIDITENLDRFDKPVLLILGKYDFLTGPPELWEGPSKKFKELTIEIFENSAHCPQYEESKLFEQVLLEWSSQV